MDRKKREITYKDGKEDGLYTRWYENGQKDWEGTYKDGKKMDYLLFGMKMDKRKKKQPSSVGKRFLKKSGMKMGLLRIE